MAREGLQVALIASTVAIMVAVLLCWASMATTSTGQARAETGASDSQIPWLQKLDPWSAMKSNTVSGGVGEQVRCQGIAGSAMHCVPQETGAHARCKTEDRADYVVLHHEVAQKTDAWRRWRVISCSGCAGMCAGMHWALTVHRWKAVT